MYRLLEQRSESRERRDQLTHPRYQKPELLATAPNQLWSWDITKLLGPVKWTYFYLNARSIVTQSWVTKAHSLKEYVIACIGARRINTIANKRISERF